MWFILMINRKITQIGKAAAKLVHCRHSTNNIALKGTNNHYTKQGLMALGSTP
jgi:hypothetical protein